MCIKKIIISIALTFLTLSNGCVVFAMNTGFETENINSDTQERILINMDIQLLKSDINEYMISCFDVNENNGDIALCFEDSARKKIVIYDLNGNFKYGYSFMESGSIGVEWDENNIIIYSVRGDRAILINKDANFIDMKRIIINSYNNSYWHDVVFSKEKQIGDDVYTLKNSKLVKKDVNGQETMIIDRSAKKSFWNISVIFYFSLLFIIAIIYFTKFYLKNR